MKFINKDFLRQAILGVAVGDALGVPYEFCARDTFKVNGMASGGFHNQPVGTWSDDTSMTIATLDSFICKDKFDYSDIMERFSWWSNGEAYCPHGECFDIGGTTRYAIMGFEQGKRPLKCGGKSINDNGNGSLMRILPIAFVEHTNYDIVNLSSLTHAHDIACMCCRLYIEIAENLMSGMSGHEAIAHLTQCENECERIPLMKDLSREQIKSSGYVVDSFEAAVWCLIHTDSYAECVTKAVELGRDTDTIAAIAGGLAGIYYGIGGDNGIPVKWISQLARLDFLESLIERALA